MAIQLGFLELRWTLGFDLTTEGHEVEIQYVAFFFHLSISGPRRSVKYMGSQVHPMQIIGAHIVVWFRSIPAF